MLSVLFIQKNLNSLHDNKIPPIAIKFLRLLKFITSGVGAASLALFIFVWNSITSLLLILIFGSLDQSEGDNFAPLNFFDGWEIYFNIFIISSFSIIIVIDLVLNFKDFIFNWKKFWILKDPFRFRVQQIILFFAIILFLIDKIVFRYQFGTTRSNLSCLSTEHRTSQIFLESLTRFTLIFYFSGFILILTYIEKGISVIKGFKKKHEIKSDQIDDVFKKEEIFNLFHDFVKNECSLENVFLYQDIKKYEDLREMDERKQYAIELFNKYLNGDLSELEANVSGSIIRKVSEDMQSNRYEVDLFNSVLLCVKENLADTYSRFIISERFNNYQMKNELIDENIGLIQKK